VDFLTGKDCNTLCKLLLRQHIKYNLAEPLVLEFGTAIKNRVLATAFEPEGFFDLRESINNRGRSEVEKYFVNQTRSQYLGNNTVICRILGNKKFFTIANDVGFSTHMIMDGFWEYWLTKYFCETVNHGDTVIDIGANLGYFTVVAADLVSASGHVISIEPNPEIYSHLCNTISVNGYGGHVEALNFALSASTAARLAPFFVPTGEPKNGRFAGDTENLDWLAQFGSIFDVNVGYLDVERFERVDLIKIDVEGAELEVLQHIQPIIEKFRPRIVCEVNFGRGYSYSDVCNSLGGTSSLIHLDFDGVCKPLTERMAETERLNEDWLICHS
jgi:FkbM family methyltransferase